MAAALDSTGVEHNVLLCKLQNAFMCLLSFGQHSQEADPLVLSSPSWHYFRGRVSYFLSFGAGGGGAVGGLGPELDFSPV